ncbi:MULTISPECIES: glutamate--cysteine ligase [Burkholderiaceae]|uniref:glutamate--cysteine ligase n=1 Tax=Burkholderiaceae TaxID=119060 RepID=UPI00095C5DD3|nr:MULTISPECIES: glutamate--cysteine ligase [Burkholderiaceae]MCG1017289.1 glutamate--cysteine ligase [Mycetohabitans sp. B4]SIT70990.1 glutamate-cysteine ligase [Burkholderia sp. b13]
MLKNTPALPTTDAYAQRLALLAQPAHRPLLAQGLRGVEKESLRVQHDGTLAPTPHPAALGSALTHEQLTTDYSEALLEIITPAGHAADVMLEQLDTLHRYVYESIGDELLWNASMPCVLPPEEQIPIAQYGTSNIGRLKHVYRRGLALRYGRAMQCIAGIHYNFSLHEDIWRLLQQHERVDGSPLQYQSDAYLALIRNFRRSSWLLTLLFGASPALSRSFVPARAHALDTFDADTLFLPYATSLRMSDLGYQNTSAQAALHANYNSLDGYLHNLANAVSQPYAPYEQFGTQRDGEWLQINTNVLQIENEFYSTIRPKRVTRPGERPLHALASRGVQYIEVRLLDIDPFEATGISATTARFVEAYLLFCALDASPLLHEAECTEAGNNFARVVTQGRRPGLELSRGGRPVPLRDWAVELLERIGPAAALLDAQEGGSRYGDALAAQRAKVEDFSLTPSARVLEDMRTTGRSFTRFALEHSAQHAAQMRARPLPRGLHAHYAALAARSLQQQAEIERTEVGHFDQFVAAYRAYTLNRISV